MLPSVSIRRTLNGTFVRIEWSGTIEGRGDFSWMLMLNYSPPKKMHNCCLFDPSGGEPGMFYGDWTDEKTLVYKAKFKEADGSESHQRFTFDLRLRLELRRAEVVQCNRTAQEQE